MIHINYLCWNVSVKQEANQCNMVSIGFDGKKVTKKREK